MWDTVVRVLARYNVEDFPRILGWPLRDALLAYEETLRAEARLDYRVARLEFAMLAPHVKELKPPKLPAILRGR